MNKTFLLGAALLAAMITPAFAQETYDHTGLNLSLGASQFDGDVTFSGGKPTEALSGTLTVASIGGDYQFGTGPNGFVLGASYFQSVGDGIQSGPVRDGNLLVQDARLDGLSGFEVRAGYAFGNFLPYVSYHQTKRDLTVSQSCPDNPAASVAVGGFCAGGFNLGVATTRAGRREGDAGSTADGWGAGIEWNATEHVFLDLNYSQTDYGTEIVPLSATGNTPGQVDHPPTDPTQDSHLLTLRAGWRF